MASTASGPTMAGGTQPIVKDGYELLYLPDVNNDALQREGKAAVYYYLPNAVRIARKGGQDAGDFLFNLIRSRVCRAPRRPWGRKATARSRAAS